jgi:hypothetical protein
MQLSIGELRFMKIPTLAAAVFAAALIIFSSIPANAQKINVNDLIAKHLDSIGPKDKRDAVKNQLLLADARVNFRSTTFESRGKGLIVSEKGKILIGMKFDANDYPQDRFAFDGKKVAIDRPSNGKYRSILGEFIFNSEELLEDGLLGGTLSASWLLMDVSSKGKASYEGTKKLDGVDTNIIEFMPKGGSDLTIKIYLDAKTNRHIRTEYTRVINAALGGSVDTSAGISGKTYTLTEDFGDFKKMGDLTLPSQYKITHSIAGAASIANRDVTWIFTITDCGYNRELDANSFNINN